MARRSPTDSFQEMSAPELDVIDVARIVAQAIHLTELLQRARRDK